ncbi:hypothetical protein APHAL10511_007011 [Amanita phalloides]|nr:hypothetical protein APHAL10511_007011 [Amanita phalloides]
MSLTVGHIITHVDHIDPGRWSGPEIATTLAFICGFIVLGIGLLRLGWIIEFIPAPAVSGFMTGSALNIASGQVVGLMGISGVNTRNATYRVIIDTLKGLPRTRLDAAWGLTGLVVLYLIRTLCSWLSKRYPSRARAFFFLSVMRNASVIVVLTIASWLYCRHRFTHNKYPINILKTVPSGFKHVGQPQIDRKLLVALAPDIPVATIILLLEHIAIAKSFGRLYGYKINPNQELIAIGVTNTVGSCFGAYPATGSFSRSALKAKSGVRTPAAGILTAIVVIVALYGLTKAFFWIPNAGLSAVIIHAVADLVASPAQVYSFWRISPLEFFIWVATVLVAVFSTIENGIYTSVCASLALFLIRVAHPRGFFLGKALIRGNATEVREVFLPLEEGETTTESRINVVPPLPGVIIYRFEDSYVYPNCSKAMDLLVDYVRENTRRSRNTRRNSSDRLWNDAEPRNGDISDEKKPNLRAIVLDFSTVSQIDTTAVQSLIDARAAVERWAGRAVEFHFATVLSPWIRRALIAGGFGIGIRQDEAPRDVSAAVPIRDDIGNDIDAVTEVQTINDVEAGSSKKGYEPYVVETPFFHLDLYGAVQAAETSLRNQSL